MSYTEGKHDDPADTQDRLVRVGTKYSATAPSVADGDNVYLLTDSAGRPMLVGPTASDAPEVGNPVQIGGSVDDTAPAAAGEGDVRRFRATPEGNFIAELYKDNTPWGNTEITLLASASRNGGNSPDQINELARGILITLDITVAGAAGTTTFKVQHKDPVSGKYENLLSATFDRAVVATHTYLIYPGAGAASGDITAVAPFPLGRTWRVVIQEPDGVSYTNSVGASYIV